MTLSISSALPAIEQLPDTFCIQLTQLSAIKVSGEDKTPYLQGQLTCDINNSDLHSYLPGAHCDAKGKVLSAFRFINRLDSHLLIQPSSCLEQSMTALLKFGVFAKVDITASDDLSFYALVGAEASTIIQQKFGQVPDAACQVVQCENTTLVYLGGQQPRYLLIDSAASLPDLIEQVSLPVYGQGVWDLLEIHDGFPILSAPNLALFVPQMLNLQALNAISFTKGCYIGQETVARMQYLGKNKRALFTLTGSLAQPVDPFNTVPIAPGDIIEQRLGENWRKVGNVLMAHHSDNGALTIQGVLAKDLEPSVQLRLKNQPATELTLHPLPYSLSA